MASPTRDATNPDLSEFYRQGGQLIVWHAVGDACVSYERTAQYMESVKAGLGPTVTAAFTRFYTSPGTGHGMGGPGAITVPLFSALQSWVESNHAPGSLTATLSANKDLPIRTRPLCQFPLFPRYKGKGDPNAAMSFICSSS